jgi:hypothetical protein
MKLSGSGFYSLVVTGFLFVVLLEAGCVTKPPPTLLYTGSRRPSSEVGRVLINEGCDVTIDGVTFKMKKPSLWERPMNGPSGYDRGYSPSLVELLPGSHEITATFSRLQGFYQLEIIPSEGMTRHLTANIEAGREYFVYFEGSLTYHCDPLEPLSWHSRWGPNETFKFFNVELKCQECGLTSTASTHEMSDVLIKLGSMEQSANDEGLKDIKKALYKKPSKNYSKDASGKFIGGW